MRWILANVQISLEKPTAQQGQKKALAKKSKIYVDSLIESSLRSSCFKSTLSEVLFFEAILSVVSCLNANYDIVAYPCRQNWDGTTTYASTNNATTATAGEVMVTSSNTIAFIEYAAETNNSANCGDGWSGDIPNWPCISDAPCIGSTFSGHHRGMCQWGSHRWAQQGKTNTWILDHYYNPGGIYRCNSSTGNLIKEDLNNYINIFPNPTNGWFTIEINNVINKKINCIVTNNRGQIIYTIHNVAKFNQYVQPISLKGLANGNYFLKISIDGDDIFKIINLTE